MVLTSYTHTLTRARTYLKKWYMLVKSTMLSMPTITRFMSMKRKMQISLPWLPSRAAAMGSCVHGWVCVSDRGEECVSNTWIKMYQHARETYRQPHKHTRYEADWHDPLHDVL
jgi:hypothetical protein